MFAKDLASFLSLLTDVEVPRLVVVGIVDGDVQGQARREELAFGPSDFGGHSRRRVDLGYYCFGLKISDAAQQLLREYIISVGLKGSKT